MKVHNGFFHMAMFRVIQGGIVKETGKKWGQGTTVEAKNAREAVRKVIADDKAARLAATFWAYTPPAPVQKVYEMIEVAESDWK